MNVEERLFQASLSETNVKSDMNEILEFLSNLTSLVKAANPQKVEVFQKYEDSLIQTILKEGMNSYYSSKIKLYIPYDEDEEKEEKLPEIK